jgi:L-fuconolactonase
MTGNLEPWASDLREVARLPNVVVKCSGLVERAGIEWSVSALRPYVETVVSAFGPSRVMFATNWPVLEISGNYAGWTEAFRSICNELRLAPADVERMFEGTARRVYSLSDP